MDTANEIAGWQNPTCFEADCFVAIARPILIRFANCAVGLSSGANTGGTLSFEPMTRPILRNNNRINREDTPCGRVRYRRQPTDLFSADLFLEGGSVHLHFNLDKCHLFDGSSERRLATGLAAIDQN
jgi:hypothetical protein